MHDKNVYKVKIYSRKFGKIKLEIFSLTPGNCFKSLGLMIWIYLNVYLYLNYFLNDDIYTMYSYLSLSHVVSDKNIEYYAKIFNVFFSFELCPHF